AAKPEEKKAPPPPLMRGLETGLMPPMDEGAFVLDYWAPGGTPLARTEEMLRKIEDDVLSRNPDIESYVRRTGAELGLFATQTNRGDVQLILRPSEVAPLKPWTLLKPVRPPFEQIEKEMKEVGKKLAAEKYGPTFTEAQAWTEAKAYIRGKYRRRTMNEVRD